MSGTDRARALDVARGVGWCEQPIRLRATHRLLHTRDGEITQPEIYVACESRRAARCRPCSRLYQGDAYFLLLSGLLGTKDVGVHVRSQPAAVLTLTAPGADVFGSPFHFADKRTRRACNPARQRRECPHGIHLRCGLVHDDGDPRLGTPLCSECFNYAGAVSWNGAASTLWNRFVTYLRRAVPADVQYVRTVEPQRRGLIHIHAILRFDFNTQLWTEEHLDDCIRLTAARVSVGPHHFGPQMHVDFISTDVAARQRTAGYLAKYATTSATDFQAKVGRTNQVHLRKLQDVANASLSQHYVEERRRRQGWLSTADRAACHAKARAASAELGYRGHFLSKSGGYSTTFASLRAARREYATAVAADAPSDHWMEIGPTGWTFMQQGYLPSDAAVERLTKLAVDDESAGPAGHGSAIDLL